MKFREQLSEYIHSGYYHRARSVSKKLMKKKSEKDQIPLREILEKANFAPKFDENTLPPPYSETWKI